MAVELTFWNDEFNAENFSLRYLDDGTLWLKSSYHKSGIEMKPVELYNLLMDFFLPIYKQEN